MEPKPIFVGRQNEQTTLLGLLKTPQAELVALIGRRRVGKTYLIKQTYANRFAFHITGIKNADKATMIRAFVAKIEELSGSAFPIATPDNWLDAFRLLKNYLAQLDRRRKPVIFLDEFPWMDSHRSGFLAAFEFFWNDWAVDQRLVVVICGSSSSWMLRHVLDNTGGLHNRITQYIHLNPFSLRQTGQFLQAKGIRLPLYEQVQLYMALGGIPYYLQEVRGGESALQTIDRVLFSGQGTLQHEFSNLYRALFDEYEPYEAIVKALASRQKGLTRQEIIEATRLSNGGSLTRMLTELEQNSFIRSVQPFANAKRDTLYRLVDEYSLFWLHFGSLRQSGGNFLSLSQTARYKSWAGFAFESLCLKHVDSIRQALGIGGIVSRVSSYYQKGTPGAGGYQIDLLIDRNDNAINLCEMKFYGSEYELSKAESTKLRQRREAFRSDSGTRKHLINTLVTTYGLKENVHSVGVVDQVLALDALFG